MGDASYGIDIDNVGLNSDPSDNSDVNSDDDDDDMMSDLDSEGDTNHDNQRSKNHTASTFEAQNRPKFRAQQADGDFGAIGEIPLAVPKMPTKADLRMTAEEKEALAKWLNLTPATKAEDDPRSDDEELLPVPSNDDLLYDSEEDVNAQKWIDKERQRQSKGGKAQTDHQSDAILSCPCCFSIVCIDCQRHESYPNQFRAMFLHRKSCYVVQDEVLQSQTTTQQQQQQTTTQEQQTTAQQQQHQQTTTQEQTTPTTTTAQTRAKKPRKQRQRKNMPAKITETFWPVKCAVCNTEVGVMDEDEVFHLFNVVPSQA